MGVRLEVGAVYIGVSTDPGGDDGFFWRFQIIARLEQDGRTYFAGIMEHAWNGSVQMFTPDGESIDTSRHSMGYRLVERSKVKAKWAVSKE